jgi:hypothetical protein
LLKLPVETGPEEFWLTEFEDNWPYRAAPADISFSRDSDQSSLERPPIIEYVATPHGGDAALLIFAAALALPRLMRRGARGKRLRS